MKRLFQILAVTLLSATSSELCAQHNWAMAFVEKGQDIPTVVEYHSAQETAENGIVYNRIFDDSYRIRGEAYNPVKLQYGYRWTDKKMFVYDFEKQEETLAFDFNLSEGDHFTTYNDMEWEIESVKDTLVNISFCGKGESVSKRLLTARTLDGKLTDKWLEDFGSFTNLFMISSMENVECSQTLWMEYAMGEYLTCEICTGPIFGHDTGWLDGAFEASVMPYTVCTYNNGQLIIEDVQLWYEHRDYICFYQNGDNIYKIYSWELEPHIDMGNSALRRDIITFNELPTPASGKYVVHIDDNEYTTGIRSVGTTLQPTRCVYDLQGRRLLSQPAKGVYIRDGQKVYAQ